MLGARAIGLCRARHSAFLGLPHGRAPCHVVEPRARDLLAQSESQHRVVIEAHTRLETGIAEWRINPPTPVEREDRLSMIADVACEVIADRVRSAIAPATVPPSGRDDPSKE